MAGRQTFKWLKSIILIIALTVLAFGYFGESIFGISGAALKTLCVLLATLLLLIFEVFPLPVTCVLSVILLFALGAVGSIGEALSGYANHILYFTIASFGISAALTQSVLCRRLLTYLLGFAKRNTKGVLAGFMLSTALLSSFISNVAATVIFLPYIMEFIKLYEKEEDQRKAKRTFLICLTLSAMIGGMMTPAGSSINLLVIDALEKQIGLKIAFIQWMAFGIPLSLIMLGIAYFFSRLVFPCVDLPAQTITGFVEHMRARDQLTTPKDVYILCVLIAALSAWVISSWIPSINTTVVAVIAFVLFFLPNSPVLTWKTFEEANSWPAFFIAGTMISIAGAVTKSGLADTIVNALLPSFGGMAEAVIIGIIAAMTFVFMVIVPVAPAAVTILAPIVIQFALTRHYNPILLAMVCGLCVENCYLLPLDTVPTVTYAYQGYKMFELPRMTIWVQLAMILLVSLLFPAINGLVGL